MASFRTQIALLTTLALWPTMAHAHGPWEVQMVILWYLLMLLCGALYLAAGKTRLVKRVVALIPAVVFAVVAFLVWDRINPQFDTGLSFVLLAINAAAPLIGFGTGIFCLRYLSFDRPHR